MLNISVAVKDGISKDLREKMRDLDNLPQEALLEFVALTPIDRGNARYNTRLVGDTIRANYPYAQRLNEGWSKQAPDGMEEPWNKWMDQRIKQILGK
jgi:hypothetical protein